MAFEFHYTPTGTGAISGKEVLEQTEDAINDLGNTAISGVQEALDKAEQALTNSENAVDDAQTALNTANNAEGVAVQAQNDVSNLSGTVTNIGNRVTTAEGNIGNLQGRMTTAEGNITNLQGRMTTAEGNIGNLQTAVSTAQAAANSAQQTATTARQQSYVFRYSSTALTASSTNSNSLLDNTDNLKVGDKVIDSSGNIYVVTAIDTANSTFTIGTALIDLAQDSDVVHKSGNETIGGVKTFTNNILLKSPTAEYGVTSGNMQISFSDKNNMLLSKITQGCYLSGLSYLRFHIYGKDSNNQNVENSIDYAFWSNTEKAYLRPNTNDFIHLGTENNRWKSIYATNYYYGSNNVEFSTKFVTTDTAQTISGNKTFSEDIIISNSDKSQTSKNLVIRSSKVNLGDSNSDSWGISFNAGASYVAVINSEKSFNYMQGLSFTVRTRDSDNNLIVARYRLRVYTDGSANLIPDITDFISFGSSSNKWKDVQTNKLNGLEPSALGMPDLDNGIDISSYFDISLYTGQTYTPPANGWISLSITSPNRGSILCEAIGISQTAYGVTDPDDNNKYRVSILIPCQKSQTLTTYIRASGGTVNFAKFYPCQGNV